LRILLDHCLPRQLVGLLPGHDVSVAARIGWERLTNGDLLQAAEQAGFECLLTGDRNMAYQQNLAGRKIAIVALSTNRLNTVSTQINTLRDALRRLRAGGYLEVRLELPPLRRRPFQPGP